MRAKPTLQAVVAAVGAGVFLMAAASNATAAGTSPEPSRYQFTYSGTVDCTGFQDDFTGTANDVLILFNDASGNLVGAEDHIFFREVDTNSVTGATYDLRGELIYHADLVTNVISITGAPDLANLAGTGLIVQDTGRLVLDATGSPIFQAGPHQSFDTNKQIFCGAFGQ